jgi:DNA mismatch repair protein MutS2
MLKIGKPGSSFAFEIAKNIGLPDMILDRAKTKSGRSQIDFDQQLQQLEIEKINIEKQKKEFEVADRFLAEMIDKYEKLLHDLENSRDQILQAAQEEAIEVINSSNRVIEKTIKEIKEAQAAREVTRDARKKVKVYKEELLKEKKTLEVKKKKEKAPEAKEHTTGRKPEVGDMVRLTEHNSIGEVLEIKKNVAKVLSGSVTLSVPLDQLSIAKKEKKSSSAKSPFKSIMDEINQKAAEFTATLDVRGKRGEESLSIIQRFIDDALLLSAREIRIVHGKGDGILRSIIRDYLKTIDEIEHFGNEHVERGGDGVTIIKFR